MGYRFNRFLDSLKPRRIKTNIEQFFERRYWYFWRPVWNAYYNEDTKKFQNSDYPKNARTVANSTWEGEQDLWGMFLLKLDHMIYNLRKYGNEKSYYFYSADVEKYANEQDKHRFAYKIAHTIYNSNIWIMNARTEDREFSASSNVHFYLTYDEKNDPYKIYLVAKTDELIPQEKIPKSKKLYTLDEKRDENGNFIGFDNKLADQFKSRETYIVHEWPVNKDEKLAGGKTDFVVVNIVADDVFKQIKEFCDAHSLIVHEDMLPYIHGEKTFIDLLMGLIDTVSIDIDISEIHLLSDELRKHAVGNFVKVRDMLHLRHLVKKLVNMSDTDDKYFNMWQNAYGEERQKKVAEAYDLYNKDRKALIDEIASIMYEKAPRFWD